MNMIIPVSKLKVDPPPLKKENFQVTMMLECNLELFIRPFLLTNAIQSIYSSGHKKVPTNVA